MTLREGVADDDHRIVAGLALLLGEDPANGGLAAENFEKIRIRDGGKQRLRAAAAADTKVSSAKDGYGFEHIVLLSPIKIVGWGNGERLHAREGRRGRHMEDGNDRLRIGEWEGPQEYRVHDTEDCRVRTNAERKDSERRHGEAGIFPEDAQRV